MRDTVVLGMIHGGTVTGATHQCILETLAADLGADRLIRNRSIVVPSTPSLDVGRNEVVTTFMASKYYWLLMIDSDMVWRPVEMLKFFDRATAARTPVLSGLYFTPKNGRIEPVMYGPDVEPIMEWPRGAIIQVASAGAGCLLVHRSVFARIKDKHGAEWFSTTGKGMPEDHAFCARAGAVGIPVHVDTAMSLGHAKMYCYTEDDFRLQEALKNQWATAPSRDAATSAPSEDSVPNTMPDGSGTATPTADSAPNPAVRPGLPLAGLASAKRIVDVPEAIPSQDDREEDAPNALD